MKNNFIQRAITGALFVVILVGCILYSPLSFGILFTIISALSVHEFAHLVNKSGEVGINRSLSVPRAHGLLYVRYRRARILTLFRAAALFDDYGVISEKEESHRQLGIFHIEPAIRSLAFRVTECTRFPEFTGNEQRDLQSYPAAFHLCIYLAE